MIGELSTSLAFYMSFGFEWIFPFFVLASSILILNYIRDLDLRVKIFITTLVAWYTIQIFLIAIDDGLKKDCDYQVCTFIASTLPEDPIEEPEPSPSSNDVDSLSSSSPEQTDENQPPTDSTLPQVNTDVPIATLESGETLSPSLTRSLSF